MEDKEAAFGFEAVEADLEAAEAETEAAVCFEEAC